MIGWLMLLYVFLAVAILDAVIFVAIPSPSAALATCVIVDTVTVAMVRAGRR